MNIYRMTTIGEKFDLNIQPYAILACKTDVGHHKVYYYISSRWKSEFLHTVVHVNLEFEGRRQECDIQQTITQTIIQQTTTPLFLKSSACKTFASAHLQRAQKITYNL